MNSRVKDFTGRRFGMLFVLGLSGKKTRGGNYIWKCQCDCGNITNVAGGNLPARDGTTRSCGCYRSDMISADRVEKACGKCKEIKTIDCFSKNKARKDGHSQFCKECASELDQYYRPRQREYRNGYQRNKRQTDINFRIADNLRRRINIAIKGKQKNSSSLLVLGCSVSNLIERLESRFHSGMSWENYGKTWEIDHIKPCASFDLSLPEEQFACFNYSNLQPLLTFDNRKKSSWYDGVKYVYG
jgi:hypothetical protein